LTYKTLLLTCVILNTTRVTHLKIQIGLGAQPAPYLLDVGDVFLGVKLAMA